MSLARWRTTIVDQSGNVVPNAQVEVRREALGRPLVQLFDDREGNEPLGNPVEADSEGFVSFHAAGGAYQITATASGFQRVWRYVGIGTAAEHDAVDLAGLLDSGVMQFAELADLQATGEPTSDTIAAVVLDDPDPSNNCYYLWDSGDDEWERRRSFPDSVARLSVVGGTANSI